MSALKLAQDAMLLLVGLLLSASVWGEGLGLPSLAVLPAVVASAADPSRAARVGLLAGLLHDVRCGAALGRFALVYAFGAWLGARLVASSLPKRGRRAVSPDAGSRALWTGVLLLGQLALELAFFRAAWRIPLAWSWSAWWMGAPAALLLLRSDLFFESDSRPGTVD